jgi:putative tricarboxylic transport membrane protein
MVRYKYPVSATVVGLLLGRIMETESILSFQVSGGRLGYILERPGAIAIFALMLLSIGTAAWSRRRKAKTSKKLLPEEPAATVALAEGLETNANRPG